MRQRAKQKEKELKSIAEEIDKKLEAPKEVVLCVMQYYVISTLMAECFKSVMLNTVDL